VRPPAGVPRVRDYLHMLSRFWWVIVLATILSALAVVISDRYLREPVYAASTQLFAVVPGDAQTHAAYEGNRAASVRMDTYAQLATSTIVTLRTIDELGLDETPEDLAKRISVKFVPGTLSQFSFPVSALLGVQVTGGDAGETVKVANAVARHLIEATQETEWTGTESGPALVLVDQATSAQAVRASWLPNATFGAIFGLVLSCLAVLATGAKQDRILNRGQLAHLAEQSIGGDRGGRA